MPMRDRKARYAFCAAIMRNAAHGQTADPVEALARMAIRAGSRSRGLCQACPLRKACEAADDAFAPGVCDRAEALEPETAPGA